MPRPRLFFAAAAIVIAVLYLAGQRDNPPGFHFDEVSIAYNALSIAETGRDEHGERYPVYFKSLGDYKNPTYIYLLSGLFKVVTPSNLAARRLSAILGIAAVLCLGALGWRVTRDPTAALVTLLSAALTPLLFDISRLAFEVAFFPLAIALFLLAARSAYESERWGAGLVVALAISLALVTYSYTAGRLLGPLFALLLLVFVTRERAPGLIATWMLYALTLTPIAMFSLSHPGAFLSRARYLASDTAGPFHFVLTLAWNFLRNLEPFTFALVSNPNYFDHSGGPLLLMTFPLAVAGILVARRERWTWFILAATLLSIVPASATRHLHHEMRLSPYVVLLIAAGAPALCAPRLRTFTRVMLIVGALQAGWYFSIHHAHGKERHAIFDVGSREVVEAALAGPERPIYVLGRLYSHAYWYGALNGVGRSAFQRINSEKDAPKGSVILSEVLPRHGTTILLRRDRFVAYIAP